MKTEILFTLKDGASFTDRKAMIKHLDHEVETKARKLSEKFAHKSTSEILTIFAHEGMIEMRDLIEAEDYQEKVRRQSYRVSLEFEEGYYNDWLCK